MATVTAGLLGSGAPFEATQDALFGGSMILFQPRRGEGYRTNVDALLLAAFAAAPRAGAAPPSSSTARVGLHRPFERGRTGVAFDLGAGVGAVGLSLLWMEAVRRVVLVELDEAAANMARRNLDANRWADRGEVIRGDVRDVGRVRPGEADLVVCNPPYVTPGRGQVRVNEEHARVGELELFVTAARQVAGQRARVCFVYPARELGRLFEQLTREGLHPKRIRFVHATADAPARIVLLEAQAARPGGLFVVPPLVEHDHGAYTPEMAALLASGAVSHASAPSPED